MLSTSISWMWDHSGSSIAERSSRSRLQRSKGSVIVGKSARSVASADDSIVMVGRSNDNEGVGAYRLGQ